MKLAKSLLLGSAAALATVAGAQAADLPVTKAAPVAVEYVRVCSTYGAGFFVIPGTDSCIKLGGRVRFDALVQERRTRAQDTFGFRVRGRMSFDVRTPTQYGLLRTFVRYRIDYNNGSPFNGGVSTVAHSTILDQAFIQFGGLTAGRTISFFSNADDPTRHFGTLRFDDDPDVATFAYTYAFGNGFSASVAAESPWERDFTGAGPIGGAALPARFRFTGVNQGGYEFPDFVGNLKYTGTWGGAQLSGAVHQITDIGVAPTAATGGTVIGTANGVPVISPIVPGTPGRRAADDEIGFAVSGSAYVNLPMITQGSSAWVVATYADGALGYVTGNTGTSAGSGGNFSSGRGFGFGNAGNLPFPEAVVSLRGNNIETTEAFSVAGGYNHQWTPTFDTNIFGSYLHTDFPGGADATGRVLVGRRVVNVGRVGLIDFDEYRIGGNAIWRPVSGFQIGVEVLYTNLQPERGRIAISRPTTGAALGRTRFDDEDDALEGRLRVQRDF